MVHTDGFCILAMTIEVTALMPLLMRHWAHRNNMKGNLDLVLVF